LRQIECVHEHGLLLLNVIFAGMFPQAPLPDYVREGAAADPESVELKALALKGVALKFFVLNLEVLGRGLAAIGYLFVFHRLPLVEG
jgi:hypothetical protein